VSKERFALWPTPKHNKSDRTMETHHGDLLVDDLKIFLEISLSSCGASRKYCVAGASAYINNDNTYRHNNDDYPATTPCKVCACIIPSRTTLSLRHDCLCNERRLFATNTAMNNVAASTIANCQTQNRQSQTQRQTHAFMPLLASTGNGTAVTTSTKQHTRANEHSVQQ